MAAEKTTIFDFHNYHASCRAHSDLRLLFPSLEIFMTIYNLYVPEEFRILALVYSIKEENMNFGNEPIPEPLLIAVERVERQNMF